MSKLTDEYGEFICLHEGIAKLNETVCEFEFGQKADSTLILSCSSREIFDPSTNTVELAGRLKDGTPVCAIGKTRPRCSLSFPSEDSKSSCYFRSHVGFRLNLGETDWKNVSEVRFSIANFFFGGSSDDSQDFKGNGRKKLEISLGDFDLYFKRSADYKYVEDEYVFKGKSGITCELVIEVDGQPVEHVINFANDICILLAIATGRTVDWSSMRLFDSNSSLLRTHYQHRRISAVGLFDIIDFGDMEVAVTYLTKCYPEYKKLNPQFHIDTADL